MAKKTDFTKYTADDLAKEMREKREALRSFRFGSAGSRSRNVREGRTLRKDVARLMTEVNARNLPVKAKVAKGKKTA